MQVVLPVLADEKVIRMRKIKSISVFLCAVFLASLTVIAAYAETIYEYYGYSYTIVDNKSLSLVGWDNSSPELVVPDSINGRNIIDIGNYSFEGNTEITSVDFSKTYFLNRIGLNAFYGCTSLNTELTLKDTITIIENCAFQGCSSLPKVNVNAKVSAISNQCFYKCTSLTEAVLYEGVESINPWAFASCTELEYVNIPKSVTYIAKSAFNNDPNLTLGVWYNSYGYHYAKENNINYTLLDGVKLGDVDGNGDITISDATAVQRYLAELDVLDDIHLYAADANGDGDVDISDATAIQMAVAEISTGHTIGEVITK